jgi:hypothetical protein
VVTPDDGLKIQPRHKLGVTVLSQNTSSASTTGVSHLEIVILELTLFF